MIEHKPAAAPNTPTSLPSQSTESSVDFSRIDQFTDICVEAVGLASHALIEMHGSRRLNPRQKEDRTWVSNADMASEAILMDYISRGLRSIGVTDFSFASEETAFSKLGKLTVVLDPLDGSSNYLRGGLEFGIIVSLLECDDHGRLKTRAGIIAIPTENVIISVTRKTTLGSNTSTYRFAEHRNPLVPSADQDTRILAAESPEFAVPKRMILFDKTSNPTIDNDRIERAKEYLLKHLNIKPEKRPPTQPMVAAHGEIPASAHSTAPEYIIFDYHSSAYSFVELLRSQTRLHSSVHHANVLNTAFIQLRSTVHDHAAGALFLESRRTLTTDIDGRIWTPQLLHYDSQTNPHVVLKDGLGGGWGMKSRTVVSAIDPSLLPVIFNAFSAK